MYRAKFYLWGVMHMQNNHKEFVRLTNNKKTACLMVHGIVGSPRYFDNIIPLLPEEWNIYNILLDGHGKHVSDFCKTNMKKWKSQVEGMVKMLSDEYDEVIIIAHSMGTLLSIEAAEKYPVKIKHMILFAVPVCPRLKAEALYVSLKVILKKVNEESEAEVNARRQYSIEPDWRLWRYVGFAPRYMELLSLCRKVREKINTVTIPATVFMCGKDEMVSGKSIEYLCENTNFENHCLDNSSHNWFNENDFEYVKHVINRFLKR